MKLSSENWNELTPEEQRIIEFKERNIPLLENTISFMKMEFMFVNVVRRLCFSVKINSAPVVDGRVLIIQLIIMLTEFLMPMDVALK